ncbi:MAG TPA: hypothetical protein VEX88_13455 [Glaciibacter sp.]|nr:hypothetical protein [Glaciibacter sp.]
MLISYHGHPVNEFLEVIALSDHEWRVCDGRIDPSDASRLLGFIELENGAYEVLRFTPSGAGSIVHEDCENFDCLAAALASLSEAPPVAPPVVSSA